MSPKTKRRRRRRKAIASMVRMIGNRPVRGDYESGVVGDMRFNVAWTSWMIVNDMCAYSPTYGLALAKIRAAL